MEDGECRVVHFCVGAGARGRLEAAAFSPDISTEELKELFRSAAEAGPLDVLKLYGAGGRLLNISPRLAPNSPDRPYRLEVVAAHCHGMLLEEVGVDLRALEDRVSRLEKQLRGDADELPPIVMQLQQQVERFRTKLETTEHLSWLGFYKELPPPLSTEACRRLQYRRKSDSMKKRVREKFYSICDAAVSEEVRLRLRQPTFDSCQWEDEEILLLLQQMFIDLDLPSKFGIEMTVLRAFLYEVYKNYNEVPFHNFRHCFCVAQMMYAMVWCVDLPALIGDMEVLVLLTSCICHDLDHPGYNNIYQINAKTELALRYNDISPLENHHCSVAFRVLENPDCNIFKSLPPETFRQIREGMIRCILATDMARHNEILGQFREVTPEFDFNNKAHINLLSMVLIKVADISNEARPMEVAEPWLDRLLQEFFKQSDAEKLEGLPVTPFMDRDKVTKPSSQCSFIGLVLLPLFEALGQLFPALQPLIVQPVREALEYYRRLNDRLHRKSVADAGSGDSVTGSLAQSGSAHSVKSRRSVASRSRSADVDDGVSSPQLENTSGLILHDHDETETFTTQEEEGGLNEEDEDGDETVTEVEVSEKTLKFKIATESTNTGGRRSYPGSRKGSREKAQELQQAELTRAVMLARQRSSITTPVDACNGGDQTARKSPDPQSTPELKPASLLSRLRNLTERLPFSGSCDDSPSQSPAPSTLNCQYSPPVAPGSEVNPDKAMTLPKMRKPHRRGWRSLIGGGSGSSKGEVPSSSLELLSPSEASPTTAAKRQLFRNKRNSYAAGSLDSVLQSRGSRSGSHSRKTGLLSQLAASFRSRRGTPRSATVDK
ncbi:high affinity cGMP-specific 3',5'-cyclic phosphodiesterase 9A [Anabrus simplex]|uniref:high affinity cGMP-specific 3',5'-cyclic phosphodiesterase 9A n=1 Tax=Anabrus simplex TaxID=316456 RepID=UPI0034DD3B9D